MLQTTDCEREAARRALAGTGRFTPEAVRAARFRRLKGLTNRVYKAELGPEAYCLRIPGAGTAAFIDRRAEAVNARAAAHTGVAPEVLHFGADGIMLTPFIGAAVTLSAERFRSDPGAVSRAVRALHTFMTAPTILHGSSTSSRSSRITSDCSGTAEQKSPASWRN
jgi:thiamine kinase-like enzyme